MTKYNIGAVYVYENGEPYTLREVQRISGDSSNIGGSFSPERVIVTFVNWNNGETIKISEDLVDTFFTEYFDSVGCVEEEDASAKKYRVEVYGCDDSTSVEEELTDKEYTFLKRIADNITNASEYGCMPTMDIREVD